MNILDLLLIIIIALGFVYGYRRGLIKQAARLAGWLVAVVVAWYFKSDVADFLSEFIPYPGTEVAEDTELWLNLFEAEAMYYGAIAFLALFIITIITIRVIAWVLDKIAKLPGLNLINRLFGALLGSIQTVLVAIIIVCILMVLPWETGQHWLDHSRFAQHILTFIPF